MLGIRFPTWQMAAFDTLLQGNDLIVKAAVDAAHRRRFPSDRRRTAQKAKQTFNWLLQTPGRPNSLDINT